MKAEANKQKEIKQQRRIAKIRFWLVSLILGLLLFIALCLVGVVIIGMVKVQKIQKEFTSWKESYRWDLENSHRRFDESWKYNQEKFTDF